MKKILLSAISIGLLASVHSQVILSETFDSGTTATTTIPGWTSINNDGLTSNSATLPNGFYMVNNQAGNQSWNTGSAAQSDDWLIHDAGLTIPVSTTGTYLTWGAQSTNANFLESYEVIINTTGSSMTDFIGGTSVTIKTVVDASSTWTGESVDLTAYEGQTIYLAYHVNSTDEDRFAMDDVLLYQPFANDMRIIDVTVDNGLEGDRTFTITCENYGGNTVTTFDLDWDFSGSSTTTENVTGVSLTTGQTYDVVVNVNGVAPGSGQTFNADITTSDDDNTNNTLSEDFNFDVPVPQYVGTDSHGNPFDLHAALSSGQSIILDFMASWCGPCESSTPELAELIQENGGGNGNIQALAISVESSDDDATVNALGWSSPYDEYPIFSYTTANNNQYYHYAVNHGFNTGGSIPFFVMICPNPSDPGHSTIIKQDVGFGTGMFAAYKTELDGCSTAVLSLEQKEGNELVFEVFPNPATDLTNVQFTVIEPTNVSVELVNALGQVVTSNKLGEVSGSQLVELSTTDLDAGIYMVNINVGGVITSKKLSVRK